ncbi:deoxyribodipyrimidine photo-lyase [Primorskyibacter flagellatus]|uniref:Deoxyribodipyrimidine photo-lyase n=1 Tax=Primorskyibacter flagellatus TaxID=1387277 RepID=A0A916ZXM9_9RHOB|nr:cryptochrome/photolyase family protein [Primorskyibacter flagellatus]GGE18125.1 deoxyribodipyrimidine photo-lyase [Primorskyibacter flagellatus]
MVRRVILVLGDQLSPELAVLRDGDPEQDVVVMAEVPDETGYVPHHPKKIALVLSAMRHFAEELRADGWTVRYFRLEEDGPRSICGALMAVHQEVSPEEVVAVRPGEHRLIEALEACPVGVRMVEDDRFLCSVDRFRDWAQGRKELRMEWFYREMRRETGLLMDGDQPAGGTWNYDKQNRKPAQRSLLQSGPMEFTPDAITETVLAMVRERFAENFGTLDPFTFGVTRTQARRALAHFVKTQLPGFGDTQDAMLLDEPYLNHGVLSVYMNLGLLLPREVCEAADAAYRDGQVPINSAEGFIRQILGWREYVRGIYFLKGPEYVTSNTLGHTRDLPAAYWGGETDMRCIREVVAQTRDLAYAHHIQRLMITGNYALLLGVDPAQVHEWYLSVYADAYEWVEAPNTVGMSQWADGGVVASKPYVSSANYIDRMSDYCTGCAFDPKVKVGEGACPFNLLYWDFLVRHRERFEGNRRMGVVYKAWDGMGEEKRREVLRGAETLGEVI